MINNRGMKALSVLLVLILTVGSLSALTGCSTATEGSPDYSYSMELPSDGSNDTGDLYKITRRDTSSWGNISIEAYKDDMEVYITLENIEKVVLYFNETDVDLETYTDWVGGDIDIIIDNDGSSLDGEFHGIPKPSEVGVETSWMDYSHSDNVLSFTGLETSTTTITLSYEGWVDDIVNIVIFTWMASFLIFILKYVMGVFQSLSNKMSE